MWLWFVAGPRVIVKSATGFLCQVVEKLIRFKIVAVERDRVNGRLGPKLGLTNDRLQRL